MPRDRRRANPGRLGHARPALGRPKQRWAAGSNSGGARLQATGTPLGGRPPGSLPASARSHAAASGGATDDRGVRAAAAVRTLGDVPSSAETPHGPGPWIGPGLRNGQRPIGALCTDRREPASSLCARSSSH
jgi:hypothetical protein